MMIREYLLAYGCMGDVGRFRPLRPLQGRRGDRVVVETFRGLELGTLLCEATPRHAHFFVNTSVGKLLRVANAADETASEEMRQRAQKLFEASRSLCLQLELPLEILDAEVLLDGTQAVLHHLPWADCDERPFVSTLSQQHELRITLHNLTLPKSEEEEEHAGCGKPGCGTASGGGCGSCSSGGGCSSCGVTAPEQAHFAGLRAQMHSHGRTNLM